MPSRLRIALDVSIGGTDIMGHRGWGGLVGTDWSGGTKMKFQ